MRSKQYFTSIKNNPHEISTDPKIGQNSKSAAKLYKILQTKNCFPTHVEKQSQHKHKIKHDKTTMH